MVPTVARADDPYEPQVVPKCTVYQVAGGEICGYTMDEWKVVLRADAELVSTRILLAKEKARANSLSYQVGDLRNALEVYAENQKLLVANMNKLTTDLIACDKDLQDERVKPRIGSPVAWTIAAAVAVMFGGYLLKDKL